jgi:DNA sulfur modification protein DndD
MILERLVLEDFRQFKGRQELVFSTNPEQNVTLVHAENSFGKTTILKALLWVLYGRDGLMGTDGQPDDFEKPDRLLNESVAALAKDANRAQTVVELTFKHEGDRYILRRSLTLAQQKLNPKETELNLVQIRNGESYRQDNPQRRLLSIVPDGIRRLLFFNGERINYLALERSSHEVAAAIRQMLGLELLRDTIDDLNHPNVKGKLKQDLKSQPTSHEMETLIASQDSLEAELAGLEESKKQIHRNIQSLANEVQLINASLEANKEAHELAVKRGRLEKEQGEIQTRLDETSKKLARLIAEDGYMLFTSQLVERGQDIVRRLRAEGKIPARVLNTFLQDLLENEECICTRELNRGTQFRVAVEQLLQIAGDADFNNAVGALDHAIGVLQEGARKTEERIRELNVARLEMRREIADIEGQIEEISPRIRSSDQARDLEDKRSRLLLNRDSQNAELGRTEGKIEDFCEELERVKIQIRGMEEIGATAGMARKRLTALEDCVEILERILQAETEDLRPLLNEEITKHFRKIMDRDFWPELSDDFTLRIRKRVAGVLDENDEAQIDAALGTGQRTVTSLVFIASLVALANRRSEIPTIIRGLSGSAYPIIIDSPFGSLSTFCEDVAHYIPEIAPQVVLLVSPKQYEGTVHQALVRSRRVGKRYYLTFTGPTMPDRANPQMEIGGKLLQIYFPSADDEFTTVCEL